MTNGVRKEFVGIDLNKFPGSSPGIINPPGPPKEDEMALLGAVHQQVTVGATGEGMYGVTEGVGKGLEDQVRVPVAENGELKLFIAKVVDNTLDVDAEITVAINGVLTSMTLTIPAGATGIFGPVAGPESISAGDSVSFICDVPSSANAGDIFFQTSVEYIPS